MTPQSLQNIRERQNYSYRIGRGLSMCTSPTPQSSGSSSSSSSSSKSLLLQLFPSFPQHHINSPRSNEDESQFSNHNLFDNEGRNPNLVGLQIVGNNDHINQFSMSQVTQEESDEIANEGSQNIIEPRPHEPFLLDESIDWENLDRQDMDLNQCFDLLKEGYIPHQPLHENRNILKLMKTFLLSIFRKSPNLGGNAQRHMYHCRYCKQRWFDTKFGGRVQSEHGGNPRDQNDTQCLDCKKQITFVDPQFPNQIPVRLYSKDNDMDPWVEYSHLGLAKLNEIEQMLISQIHPYMKLFRLNGGGIGYKGSVLNVEQDISQLVESLPLLPEDLPCFVVQKPNSASPLGFREFKVNRENIRRWLIFLKANNRYYVNIEINMENIRGLPEDGSIADQIRTIDEDDADEILSQQIESQVDIPNVPTNHSVTNQDIQDIEDEDETEDQEYRPETGGASGNHTSPAVRESFLHRPINSCQNGETEMEANANRLQEMCPNANPPAGDTIPWPQQGRFVNDFTEPGILSRAFPTLFPYAKGDVTFSDRVKRISMIDGGKHLLKYCVNLKNVQAELLETCEEEGEQYNTIQKLYVEGKTNEWSYPFVESDRFVHWIQNTVERHRAAGQRSFWISKHSEYANLSVDELHSIINHGGLELKSLIMSMQSQNANITGSPQYLYKKRKLLESLCQQKVRTGNSLENLFFLLSKVRQLNSASNRECVPCGILFPWQIIIGMIFMTF